MNANEIDELINDNINNINIENENNNEDKEYNLILFSDGAHERVKKRSAFGIYVYCKNNKSEYNKYNDNAIKNKELIESIFTVFKFCKLLELRFAIFIHIFLYIKYI